mgnify:CR=1 FL=1
MLDTTEQKENLLQVSNIEVVYNHVILVLRGVSLNVLKGGITAILGGNGAGKSTLFDLIMGKQEADEGEVNIFPKTSIAISRQVIPRDELELTVREFFEKCFSFFSS